MGLMMMILTMKMISTKMPQNSAAASRQNTKTTAKKPATASRRLTKTKKVLVSKTSAKKRPFSPPVEADNFEVEKLVGARKRQGVAKGSRHAHG